MNETQIKRPWGLALLSIGAGLALTAAGGWMSFRIWACPEVLVSEFRAEKHEGAYVRLVATQAFEAGYQIEYDADDPDGENDPANRVGRLMAVPVDDRLLIVLVPMNHAGTSFVGSVKELSSEIEMGLVAASIRRSFSDLDRFLDSVRSQQHGGIGDGGADPFGTATISDTRSPRLADLVLPVYLDTKEDERGAIAIVLIVGIAFLAGGVHLLTSSRRGQRSESGRELTSSEPRSVPSFFVADIEDRRADEVGAASPVVPKDPKQEIERTCPQGHAFSVASMYRGTRRRCPTCGAMVEI